jgi:hypothetical protein
MMRPFFCIFLFENQLREHVCGMKKHLRAIDVLRVFIAANASRNAVNL